MKKTEDNLDMRTLKTTTTKTITGKSTLTYQIGCLPDSSIHLRISKNTGAGMFSDEWVSYDDIQEALKNNTEGAAITSIRLTPLFKGKSVNTPSFLLAALKHLKLVRSMNGKQRHHEPLNPKPFLDTVEKLMSSDVGVKPGGKTVKKTPVKKTTAKKATVKTRTKKKATVDGTSTMYQSWLLHIFLLTQISKIDF
jgi:hypothetical protein